MAKQVAPPDAEFLERAWSLTAKAAAKGNIAVVLGTERVVNAGLRISVLVINRDGTIAGFQDKVRLDPKSQSTSRNGQSRRDWLSGVGPTRANNTIGGCPNLGNVCRCESGTLNARMQNDLALNSVSRTVPY